MPITQAEKNAAKHGGLRQCLLSKSLHFLYEKKYLDCISAMKLEARIRDRNERNRFHICLSLMGMNKYSAEHASSGAEETSKFTAHND